MRAKGAPLPGKPKQESKLYEFGSLFVLEDDLGEGLVCGVGDAEGNVFYAEAVSDVAGFAVEFYGGTAAALADDFDVDPADAAAPAGAEGFHRGFFCGEAAGVTLVFIFETLAVFAFGLAPALKRLPRPAISALDFDDFVLTFDGPRLRGDVFLVATILSV